MAQFDSEIQQMHQAASHVREVNERINQLMSSLRGEVATCGSHFHGQAAATFSGLMTRYDEDSRKLNEALRGISELVDQAGKSYTSTDESSASSLKSAGSGLNM